MCIRDRSRDPAVGCYQPAPRSSLCCGLARAGWGWTTAVFWRATNLRYWLASQGEPLSYGHLELWLAPIFTMMAAAALAASLVLLVRRRAGSFLSLIHI